jgi:hypothetical protein
MGNFFKNLFGGKTSDQPLRRPTAVFDQEAFGAFGDKGSAKIASEKTPKVSTPIFNHEEPVSFELKLPEMDQGDLIRFMGPSSVFYGALASGARELEDFCYFYGDYSAQFFFYAYEAGGTRIFNGITMRLNGGIEPWPFTGEDRVRVRANIEWLLQYKALLSDSDILPENQPDKIIFKYDL